jgi:pimeloyl-ACP methyl ester carboxylesterase
MTDIVFIHGLWVSYTAWQPWIDHYAAQDHHAIAPPWPGEDQTVQRTRENPSAQAGFGIGELTEHIAAILREFDRPPVVIGHSFGGLIAQKLLDQCLASAAIAIDPAPIKGVRALPLAQLRSAFPVLGNPANRSRAKALTLSQWRYGFGNALPSAESDALWQQWCIPSPGKPLFETASANFASNSPAKVDVTNSTRGPLLITG